MKHKKSNNKQHTYIYMRMILQAKMNNSKIWGVIKTGTNQDGATAHPITAPSAEQQYSLLSHVYTSHSIDPSSVQYIEAHGKVNQTVFS